jgi:hypothetical protein
VPQGKITNSKYFQWSEALYLPSWQVYHTPSQVEKDNIIKTAAVMDQIREFFGKPINIHVWCRPILNSPGHPRHGQDYNQFINGAANSAHKVGLAVDFDVKGMSCDDVRAKLLPLLDKLNIRMEDLPGSSWVHIDLFPVKSKRYFKP